MKVIFWAQTQSWDSHRSRQRGGAPEPGVGRQAYAGGPGLQAPRAEVSGLLAAALSQLCGNGGLGCPTKIFLWLVPRRGVGGGELFVRWRPSQGISCQAGSWHWGPSLGTYYPIIGSGCLESRDRKEIDIMQGLGSVSGMPAGPFSTLAAPVHPAIAAPGAAPQGSDCAG